MKTIIDTLKEIIKKDASTQTDPVTIIENEEIINTSYTPNNVGEKRERDWSSSPDLRKSPKLGEENLMSGIDTAEELANQNKQQGNKSDASFYDRCKAYLKIVNPKNDTYFSIKHTIKTDVIKNKQAANQSNKSIFATNFDNYTTLEEQQELLQEFTA